jgi:hypothetical protein
MTRGWWSAVAVLMTLGPAPASAERLLLVPKDPQAGVIAERLREPLAQRARGAVLLFEDLVRGIPGPIEPAPPATAPALASALAGSVRRYFYQREPQRAVPAIQRAVEEALRLLPRLVERDPLWSATRNALLLLATAALLAKDAAQARAHCESVATRDPEWTPPEADFAPPVRRLYAEVRDKLLKQQFPLRIAGAAGMTVFVDGVARGKAPLTIPVTRGEHEVQGLDRGLLSSPLKIAVPEEGATIQLDPFCTSPQNLRAPACRAALRQVGGGADLLELHTVAGSLRAERWRGERLQGTASAPLALRMERRWLAELADYLLGIRETPPVLEIPRAAPPPIYKRWWFWTLIGIAVAGGASAAVLGRPGPPTLEITFSRP